ncbi:MAG: hypothetical protein R2699_16775 [Acidimicrobiales bacterium]
MHVIDDADASSTVRASCTSPPWPPAKKKPTPWASGRGARGRRRSSSSTAVRPPRAHRPVAGGADKQSHAVIQMQGRELDGSYGACPWEAGGFAPTTASNSCWDFGVASAVVSGPTGRYQGVDTKVVDVKVGRDPSLKFDAKVQVETWHA